MAEPTVVSGLGIDTVASSKHPEAFTAFILDDKIVAHRFHLGVTLPPLAKYPLWPIGAFDLAALAAPGDRGWWMVGHQCDDSDQLGARQEPDRPGPVADPSLADAAAIRSTERSGTSDATGAMR